MEGREMPPSEEEKKGGETKMTYLSPEILAQGVEVEYHKLDYSDEGAMSSGLRFYSCDAEGKKIYLGSLNLSEYGLGRYHTLKRDHIPPELEDRIRIQTVLDLFVQMGLRVKGDHVNEHGVPLIEFEATYSTKELPDVLRWEISSRKE